jgi:hypothetical protein
MVSFCAFAGNIATSANAIANNMWSIRFISFAKKKYGHQANTHTQNSYSKTIVAKIMLLF